MHSPLSVQNTVSLEVKAATGRLCTQLPPLPQEGSGTKRHKSLPMFVADPVLEPPNNHKYPFLSIHVRGPNLPGGIVKGLLTFLVPNNPGEFKVVLPPAHTQLVSEGEYLQRS